MPEQLRLLLVRHAEPDARAQAKFGAGLTENGKRQAIVTGDYLSMDRGITTVFTSTLERARQTAAIIATQIGARLKVVPELEEI
ncbi:MAG: histidine phosphatase family protein, partial [Planctomycetota bacterium]